jgi:ribosomal-protein-alanine N-acetyltransferase
MRPRLGPLPAGAAEPLSLMHASCFPEDPWDAGSFEQILSQHNVFGYLAWFSEAPAGFVLARDLGDEADILTFGTLPEMRRRGVGRALLDAIVGQAGRRHIGSIVLEVAADNEAARRLYGAMGFVRVGRRPRYYRRDHAAIDALVLRLPIGAYRDRVQPGGAPLLPILLTRANRTSLVKLARLAGLYSSVAADRRSTTWQAGRPILTKLSSCCLEGGNYLYSG